MSVPNSSIALIECLGVSGAVAAACVRFAGRHRSVTSLVDAGLTFYLVQYIAVGLAGMGGLLDWPIVAALAAVLAAALWLGGGPDWKKNIVEVRPSQPIAIALFAVCFTGAFIWFSRFNPIPANDALTYHFPAAVLWLQTRHISLLPTWFFNPSNTYSPLVGSMFIAWLMLPFQGDTLARFVGAPVLLMVGAGVYAIARDLRVERRTACLLAAAAILSRPFLNQMLLGKDDLFVDFFFLSALLAAFPARLERPGGAPRLGTAVGLLLATKYTALLTVPVLLLAANRSWTIRRMGIAASVASLIAGPWYARNIWLTGNPVFPLALPGGVGRSLFTSAVSPQLRSLWGILAVFTEFQGLPIVFFVVAIAAIVLLIVSRQSELRHNPLLRAVVLGPVLGVGFFLIAAPFPEARFVQPEFALGFVATAVALMAVRPPLIRDSIAVAALATSVLTTINWRSLDVTWLCTWQAAVATGLGMAGLFVVRGWPRVRLPLAAGAALLLVGYTFVYFDAYVLDCASLRLVDSSPWQAAYPAEAPLWTYVAEHVPAAATLAYTNTYLIYPLVGQDLARHVVYAPTRRGVHEIADLPWLGSRLSGEALVVAASRAVAADPDRSTWLANLRDCGADYLVVVNGGVIKIPPEAAFAAEDPSHFHRLFSSPGGTIYAVQW